MEENVDVLQLDRKELKEGKENESTFKFREGVEGIIKESASVRKKISELQRSLGMRPGEGLKMELLTEEQRKDILNAQLEFYQRYDEVFCGQLVKPMTQKKFFDEDGEKLSAELLVSEEKASLISKYRHDAQAILNLVRVYSEMALGSEKIARFVFSGIDGVHFEFFEQITKSFAAEFLDEQLPVEMVDLNHLARRSALLFTLRNRMAMSTPHYGPLVVRAHVPEEPVVILGRKADLCRVLFNPARNAEKAVVRTKCEEGEMGEVDLFVEINEDEKVALVIIDDNGGGIDEEDIDSVASSLGIDLAGKTRAEKFQLLIKGLGEHSLFKDKGIEGSGQGLKIVDKFMQLHGGKVTIGDNPKTKGARIILYFPLTP